MLFQNESERQMTWKCKMKLIYDVLIMAGLEKYNTLIKHYNVGKLFGQG